MRHPMRFYPRTGQTASGELAASGYKSIPGRSRAREGGRKFRTAKPGDVVMLAQML